MFYTQEIRYVHHMEHPEYPERLGCVRAGNMEDDSERPADGKDSVAQDRPKGNVVMVAGTSVSSRGVGQGGIGASICR